ncbi:hypothetical protein AXG93_786s1300 [Marchantia polymorpha subsp. ruderalis]|uniref:Uncharacterized protein n=1 Tax=Marchantia polymorpha subsp. ruderalis TaxID=1480154 RepID=A0A176WJP4_MARPO|nr:hypothetical protein AXG93_786s1300 [Marchantia polymorpha subsp. ruderalis]
MVPFEELVISEEFDDLVEDKGGLTHSWLSGGLSGVVAAGAASSSTSEGTGGAVGQGTWSGTNGRTGGAASVDTSNGTGSLDGVASDVPIKTCVRAPLPSRCRVYGDMYLHDRGNRV